MPSSGTFSSPRRQGRTPFSSKPYRAVFTDSPDNAGTTAWRRNEKPQGTFVLPRGRDYKGIHDRARQIAAGTGTYITISRDESTSQLFGHIWGEPGAVAVAKSTIENAPPHIIQGYHGHNSTVRWARTPSHTPEARRLQDKAQDLAEQKQSYRRDPPYDAVFESIGTFAWPNDHWRLQEIFGSNLEALDEIRIDCSCFVTYDHKSSGFKASGKQANVKDALVRLRATLFQLVACQVKPSKHYVLHWRDAERIHEHMDVVTYHYPRIFKDSLSSAPKTGLTIRSNGQVSGDKFQDRPNPEKHLSIVAKKVKDHLIQALNKIKYYRGFVTLRVRLGTLILQRHRPVPQGGYTISDFAAMLGQFEFQGTVTQELGNIQLESLALKRLVNAVGFLETQSTFVRRLSDVKPLYTATLTLDADDNAGFVQLSKSWKDDDGMLLDASPPIWHRLEKGHSTAKCLLETCVIDGDDGLSWHFEMLATTLIPLEMLAEPLQLLGNFYFNIKQDEARNLSGNTVWCEFEKDNQGNRRFVPRKQALDLRTTWQFWIANSGYKIEVVKLQKVKYDGLLFPSLKEEGTLYEARWTVQVEHQNWVENLAENANLGMGKGATWRPDLETWFPMDDHVEGSKTDGYVAMMEKLFRIQGIVRGDEETEHAGMRIG